MPSRHCRQSEMREEMQVKMQVKMQEDGKAMTTGLIKQLEHFYLLAALFFSNEKDLRLFKLSIVCCTRSSDHNHTFGVCREPDAL